MLYNPPTGGAANDSYVGKNVAAGQQGSKLPPGAAEYPQREIVAAIAASGQSPTNGDLTQLLQAMMGDGLWIGTFGGTADALTATILGGVIIPAARAGMKITGLVSAASATTSPTLTVKGFAAGGSAQIRRRDGTQPAVGDVKATLVSFILDPAGNWRLGDSGASALPDAALWHFGTASNTSNTAFTTTLYPAPTDLTKPFCIRLMMPSVNGKAPTLDWGAGPKNIVINATGQAPVGGEMAGFADLTWNPNGGAILELMNPAGSAYGVTNQGGLKKDSGNNFAIELINLPGTPTIVDSDLVGGETTAADSSRGLAAGQSFNSNWQSVAKYVLSNFKSSPAVTVLSGIYAETFSAKMTASSFSVSNNVDTVIPMSALNSVDFGTWNGNAFAVTKAGLVIAAVTANTSVSVNNPGSNVNSQAGIILNGQSLPAGGGKGFDNSFNQGGTISPTVPAVAIFRVAVGDVVQATGTAYAAAYGTAFSINAGSLQIVYLS